MKFRSDVNFPQNFDKNEKEKDDIYLNFRSDFRMATANDSLIQPDHIIIWCDQNMGVADNNKDSKAVLDEHADLERPPTNEYSTDIDRFICNINPYLNKKKFEDLIRSPLRMFTNEIECLKCIHDSEQAKKHVFLITSGQTGTVIIPKVHKLLSGRIYIFCAQRDLHEQWITPYEKDIEIYDDEKGVFARVLSDIGAYYLTKAGKTENPIAAVQYYYWARRLYTSATRIDRHNRRDFVDYIENMLADLNAAPSDGYDSDIQIGQAAD